MHRCRNTRNITAPKTLTIHYSLFMLIFSYMQRSPSYQRSEQAFSLVELSIVLVILGLLTGGILAGQSLIRAAELRAVTTEYQRNLTAIQTFRDKYFAIPGDMRNAQSFWGSAASCPGTASTTAATGVPTCNGDGNGQVGLNPTATSNEKFRFWQHLANAGLIEGSFNGVGGTDDNASNSLNSRYNRIKTY